MATGSSSKPSFSRGRKWTIGLNVVLTVLAVLAVVVMVNYLSSHYYRRLYLSATARTELSPRTLSLLSSMTNQVHVTLYYDRDDPFYNDISDLLKAYQNHCPNLTVDRVDYNRDPGKAQEVKNKYKLGSKSDKNLIIFDCDKRIRTVPGAVLPEYTYEQMTNQPGLNYNLVAFKGEMMFTASILSVINPKPMRAGFLQGHGEHRMDDDSGDGYFKFALSLAENFVQLGTIKLLGTNSVPADCDLLIIPGPKDPFSQTELDRIEQYLNDGGRLFVLFNNLSSRQTGLEKILARWGIYVGTGVVKDPDNTTTPEMEDVLVSDYSRHPVVSPLGDRQIQLIVPRPIARLEPVPAAEGLKVEEIAQSGPRSLLANGDPTQKPRSRPLIVSAEKPPVKVAAEHGPTRILVMGDSICLNNRQIESGANRDFVGYAFNWLLDRSDLPHGIGPRPVTTYRWLISQSRQQALQWILLVAIPGGILMFGGLVWIRRRK